MRVDTLKKLMRLLMARFIPTHHKKFIVFISYSYKLQASRPGAFLTNFVSFNDNKCQNYRLGRGKNSPQGHRGHKEKKLIAQSLKLKGVRKFSNI